MFMNWSCICLGGAIPQIFLSWSVVKLEGALGCLIKKPRYTTSIEQDCCLLMVLLTIPIAVVLSMWIGVVGYGWPNSARISLVLFASFVLRNNVPNSASAADAATILRISYDIVMLPFNLMGSPCCGMLPRKGNFLHGFYRGLQSSMMHRSVC